VRTCRELQKGLGGRDRTRLADYLETVREIELRLQRAEKQTASNVEIPDAPDRRAGRLLEHMLLQMDLMAVAWQADVSRVFSFILNRDVQPARVSGESTSPSRTTRCRTTARTRRSWTAS
jgi:hypothetical protein